MDLVGYPGSCGGSGEGVVNMLFDSLGTACVHLKMSSMLLDETRKHPQVT